MGTLRLAWRNVWRNTRRSGVTIAAMSLALFIMVVYSGLVEGYLAGMERNILDLELGDVQVFHAGYRRDPSLYKLIEDADAVVQRLEGAGYPAAPRLLGAGLAAAGETSAGVQLRGIEVDRDRRVSEVGAHVRQGAWLSPDHPHGVVLGKQLARTLEVGVGDELVVLGQGADGSMANDLYRVRGILQGIADGVDRAGVYMTAAAFRELLVVPTGAHQIIVRRGAASSLDAAAADIEKIVGEGDVSTWRALVPGLASMLDASHSGMLLMFLIVYTAIGVVLLNAMLMAVFERVREFGVLKALGVGPFGVWRLVFAESVIMMIAALVIGLTLCVPALWYLSAVGVDMSVFGDFSVAGIAWDPIWRAAINRHTFTGPILTFVVVVICAVVYPAARAATISPLAAMRHR